MYKAAFILLIACINLAICYGAETQNFGKEDLKEDISAIYKQCRTKNYNACYILGLDYFYGHKLMEDKEKSTYYLSLACSKDIGKACVALVEFKLSSNFVIIEKACNNKSLNACIMLKDALLQSYDKNSIQAKLDSIDTNICLIDYTYCYKNIDKISQNTIKLYSDACEFNTANNGNNLICGVLGDIYSRGKVVQKDGVIARSYYGMACHDGNEFCKKAILEPILNQ